MDVYTGWSPALLLLGDYLMKRKTIQQAPRLLDGSIRVKLYGRLPDEVKEGLRDIAHHERKSMSWVIEEVIIRYFRLDKPKYKINRSK